MVRTEHARGVGVLCFRGQAQLGHTDPSLTLLVYSHLIGDSQRRTIGRRAANL
jgi:hypothetical protein